jgi:hypothetical protein
MVQVRDRGLRKRFLFLVRTDWFAQVLQDEDAMGNLTAAILVAITLCIAAEFFGNLGWVFAFLLGIGGYAGVRYIDFLIRRRRFIKNAADKN